jgi:hypothetical protein
MRTVLVGLMAVVLTCGQAVAQAAAQAWLELQWTEVYAGTNTPVANPNGILEPGEGALIRLSISFTPVGTQVQYNWPGGGVAPVAGFRGGLFYLQGTGGTHGSWSHHQFAPGFPSYAGDPSNGNLSLILISAPFPPAGSLPDPSNPIHNIWERVWTPASYDARAIQFEMRGSTQMEVFVIAGIDPSTGDPIIGVGGGPVTSSVIGISIVPTPASVLGPGLLLGLVAARRRR